MQEIWKDIKGYEGLYQVSNFGNVKSLERRVNSCNGGRNKKEKYIISTDNGNGYKIVGLSKKHKRKNYYVHRLVAEAFIKNENNFNEINHLDYNRSNNNVENLEWIDRKSNVQYSVKNRPDYTKSTKWYGKYITKDKRYNLFYVRIYYKKEKIYLGTFKDITEAMKVRDEFLERIKKNIDHC